MKRIIITLIFSMFITSQVLAVTPNAALEQITVQKQEINAMSNTMQNLQSDNQQLQDSVANLKGRISSLMQETQDLSLQNNLLKNTNISLNRELADMQQALANNQQLAQYQAATLPMLSSTLIDFSNRFMNCLQGNCHFAPSLQLSNLAKIPTNLTPGKIEALIYSKRFLPITITLLVAMILLAVLFVMYVHSFFPKRHHAAATPTHRVSDEMAEDDFARVSGEDLYASKLDLARAYIDMEDYSDALNVLKDIAKHGNDHQRDEAEHLIQALSRQA